ncbi:MAG: DNA-3-methyladenine glycosylase 2 family protein [Cyanobacteria bacterium J06607_13]
MSGRLFMLSAGEIHERFLDVAQGLSAELGNAITRNGPLTLVPRRELPFAEHLCRAVAGQQLSLRAAATIWARVIDSLPEQTSLIDYCCHVDPTQLRQCGLSMAKAKTMGEIARAAASGLLDVDVLESLTHAARSQRLLTIWGVGQWTADMMGIFYFGDADIWPEGDVTARKTLTRLTSKRRKTALTAVRFAPYRSYLALHMWCHVDREPQTTEPKQ